MVQTSLLNLHKGTCLTVTQHEGTFSFKVGIAPETLRRTNLGELKVGSKVNLERAVAGHIRFGGHFVQVSTLKLNL
jgi:riboflavin synthase